MKKIITLGQVSSHGAHDIIASEVEEGDQFGDFEVADIQEVECDHPVINWRIADRLIQGNPMVEATCQVCDDHEEVELESGDIL